MKAFVYILILNWNNWKDTVECLESVFRSDYPNYRVIVCDNGSDDDSIKYIKAWAEGKLDVLTRPNNTLASLTFPPVPKPIPYVEYDRAQAETGGARGDSSNRLILINTGANLGYGAGNNVGMRYGLARGDFDYFLILNNDTVIKPDAITKMVGRMREKPDAGICGSTLLYYDKPGKVQALGGGTYNKWLSTARQIGAFQSSDKAVDAALVESKLDYISGASCLVSKTFLQEIGLISEDYFLYFEELDWAKRAMGRYTLVYAPDSIIYHRVGALKSVTEARPVEKTLLSDYYGNKNRFLFARKYYPFALPVVYLSSIGIIINRIRRRQWKRLKMMINIMLGRCNDWLTCPELVLKKLGEL